MSFELLVAILAVVSTIAILLYCLVLMVRWSAEEIAQWRKPPVYETKAQHHRFYAGQLVLTFCIFACLVPVIVYLGAACIALPLTWR